MATATSRLRTELQPYNANKNAWGEHLNEGVFKLIDEAFGVEEIAVGANVTLTTQNFLTDQARKLVLILSGAGGFTVTAPAVDKPYLVINDCTAAVTVQPTGGTGASIPGGSRRWYYTNAAGTVGNFVAERLDQIPAPTSDVDLNSQKLTDVGLATASTDAASLANKLTDFAPPDTAIDANSQKIENVALAASSTDAASLANRLNDFAAPDNAVAFNNQKITGLADGASGTQDAAPVSQVEGLINASSMNLPTFGGNSLRYLRVNAGETAAEWDALNISDVTDAGALAGLSTINNTHWSGSDLSVANGGTGRSTLGANLVLVGNGTSGVNTLSAGTAGQVLTSNGAGSDPTFQTASSAGLVPLGSKQTIASAVAAIDFDLTAASYEAYLIKIWNFVPATDNVELHLRTSSDSISFDNTSGDYEWLVRRFFSSNAVSATSTSATQIELTSIGIGSAANEDGISGDIWITRPAASIHTHIGSDMRLVTDSGEIEMSLAMGRRKEAAAVTDVRLFMSSGNIDSGVAQLYGYATT